MSTRLQNKDKDEHDLIIMRSIPQNDITNVNVYAPNNSASKYMKQKLIKLNRETDKSTKTVGDINTPSQQLIEKAEKLPLRIWRT